MSLLISTTWDPAVIGSVSMRFTDDGGAAAVSFTTGKRAHVSAASLARYGTAGLTYATGITAGTFASQLQTAIDAVATNTITVTRSATTGAYTLTNTDGAVLSLDFTTDGAAGTRMRQILGMTADKTGALAYTSDCTPKYLLIPRNPRSSYKGIVKGQGVKQWMTSAGDTGSLAPTYVRRVTSWSHEYESDAAVFDHYADSDSTVGGQQYSWEALSDDAFQGSAICFVEDSGSSVESYGFQLTGDPVGEGSLRRVQREMSRWVVTVEASVLGLLP